MNTRFFGLALILSFLSCGPSGLQKLPLAPDADLNELAEDDESEEGMFGLTADAGGRVCRLDYKFIPKVGTKEKLEKSDDVISDNIAKSGLGINCLKFCLATLRDLNHANSSSGNFVMKACLYAMPGENQPSDSSSSDSGASGSLLCKITSGDSKILFSSSLKKNDCVSECQKKETSNPNRECRWGGEILKAYPTGLCKITTKTGKPIYNQTTTRYVCKMQCTSRENSNPYRSCAWGSEDLMGQRTMNAPSFDNQPKNNQPKNNQPKNNQPKNSQPTNDTPSGSTDSNSGGATSVPAAIDAPSAPQPTPASSVSSSAPTGSGGLTIKNISFPSALKAKQSVQVTFEIVNSGAPIQGIYADVKVTAKIFTETVERVVPIENTDTIPSGSSTKALQFTVPDVQLAADANVCVTAFSDKARSQKISDAVCRAVKLN